MRLTKILLFVLVLYVCVQNQTISAQETQYNHILTINPEESYSNLWFGYKVEISGDKLIISEPYAKVDEIVLAGKVRIYDLNGNLQTTLQSPEPGTRDQFGLTFSSNEEILIVNDANQQPKWVGRTTAFTLTGEQLFILEPNVTDKIGFGLQVKITDEYIFITQETSGDTILGAGMVHIYSIHGEYLSTHYSPDPKIRGDFGDTVESFNDRVYISQYGALGIENPVGPGYVYIFDEEDNLITRLESPEPEERAIFGSQISISDEYVVVGEPWATVDGFYRAGKAHIFNHDGEHLRTFISPSPMSGAYFGSAVAILEDAVFIGEGGSDIEAGKREGKVHVLNVDGDLLQTLTAPDPTPRGAFGYSIDVEGDLLAVSEVWAMVEDNSDCGRVYLFKLGESVDVQEVTTHQPETESGSEVSGGIPGYPVWSICIALLLISFFSGNKSSDFNSLNEM